MTTPYIESYLPFVQYHGLNTNKAATFGSTVSIAGALTLSSTLNLTGALTLGSTIAGIKPVVTDVTGSTLAPAASASGTIYTLNRAAGVVVTLPAPAVGLNYAFYIGTTVTSNSYKVITDAGTTLLIGSVLGVDTDSSDALAAWRGNGSTHIAVTQAAASTNATGGIAGGWTRFTCLTTTLWLVEGVINQAGTAASPFATS